MADYKSTPNKMVFCNGGVIKFSVTGEYATDSKAELEALSNAKGVEKVDGRSKKKPDQINEKE